MKRFAGRRGPCLCGRLLVLAFVTVVLAAAVAPSAWTAVVTTTAAVHPVPRVTVALRHDLDHYLAERGERDHFSALSLRVTYPGRLAIAVSTGTTRYGGGAPVSDRASWQIGSNTKAFTSVILLQLEAEGKLSLQDTLEKWLPRYPAWQNVTIRQLLSMTSGIPSYTDQLAFARDFAAAPSTHFTPARLLSYIAGLPTGPTTWAYSNTNYVLAQLVIERVTHDSYADQITKRILRPLGLHDTCLPPHCARGTAARMPLGYSTQLAMPRLLDKPVPPLALSWAQGAGGLVSSLKDVTTWDKALYTGELLPEKQQHELETLVSTRTTALITKVTESDPVGYGLGVARRYDPDMGAVWAYEGGTMGYRVLHVYDPRSGMVMVIAVNSSSPAGEDTLTELADSVYQTLSASQTQQR